MLSTGKNSQCNVTFVKTFKMSIYCSLLMAEHNPSMGWRSLPSPASVIRSTVFITMYVPDSWLCTLLKLAVASIEFC